jgi:hypothetical protein
MKMRRFGSFEIRFDLSLIRFSVDHLSENQFMPIQSDRLIGSDWCSQNELLPTGFAIIPTQKNTCKIS